jgi:hypothetical protein
MLEWEKILEDPNILDEQSALQQLGSEIKEIYFDMITNDKVDTEPTLFESYVVKAVEEVGKNSAHQLLEYYQELTLPRRNDSSNVAFSFIHLFIVRFHDALCAELYEEKGLSMVDTRDLTIVLAPTIITLMNLPHPYSTLAIPISVILSKIGLESLCQGYNIRNQSIEFLNKRLNIHKSNLLFLEKERIRYSPDSVPDTLDVAIDFEESKIHQLEAKLRSLQR